MKKIYFLFFILIFSVFGAQTLTQSFNEPVVGDLDRNYKLDTSAYTTGLPVNTTGNNCVWDYTKLTGIFPVIVDSFIAPSAALGATAYPGATYVQHRDPLYNFFKSTASPQQTELLGAYSPSLSLTFTNSAIIANYPLNYGYNLSDPVSGSFKYLTTTGACVGNITIFADGLGTLNFPNGVSFQNVLCLKSVQILTLSTGIAPIGTYNQSFCNYYAPGKKFPVLSVNYISYQLIGNPPGKLVSVYGSSNYFNVAGLKEAEAVKEDYQAFPNPFHERLSVNANTLSEENEYLFYNSKGELVLRTNSLSGNETEALVRGIYFLEIKGKSGTHRQKVIKD